MQPPSGTLTFLFTDIEDSSRLWEQQPEAMHLHLAPQDKLLRQAIEAHRGYIFKTVGGAFCAAFASAPEAAAAALAIQRALHNKRPSMPETAENGALRVRAALHTGAAEGRDGDYFGLALNRLSRLLAIGHGDQILLSKTTFDLLVNDLPTGALLQDLGIHRLKDLRDPEHVWQLFHPDLRASFPTLNSLDALPNNLPRQLSSFIGREAEMEQVAAHLASTSLLTLIGSGGCGKTRLALQVAADVLPNYRHGVWLVELATITDADLVPEAVAMALRLREEPTRPILETLVDHLQSRQLLLVLDNCEHLLPACTALVATVLPICPQLRILATSRERLNLPAEVAWRVPSLKTLEPERLPLLNHDIPSALWGYDACRLFIERALIHRPEWRLTDQNADVVAQICHRLDGIPLAIELAAARVRALSVEQIAARLDDCFRLLTGGSRTALMRQQTLRALIDWSYDLLSEPEQQLLNRISLFAGGWTLEAAEQVCAEEGNREKGKGKREDAPSFPFSLPSLPSAVVLDLLTSLVEKSLVIYDEDGQGSGRYRLLETVRQYGQARLEESGEAPAIHRRHGAYFVALAERAGKQLYGREQARWLNVLEAEHDNLFAALRFCLGHTHEGERQVEAGLRLASALAWFWQLHGYVSEGLAYLKEALAQDPAGVPAPVRATALQWAGLLTCWRSDYATAHTYHEACLEVQRELGDERGIAGCLQNLGLVAIGRDDHERAHTLCEEALRLNRTLGNRKDEATNLVWLGLAAMRRGDYIAARAYFEESLTISRELGDQWSLSTALTGLGSFFVEDGDFATARDYFTQGLNLRREMGNKWGLAYSLYGFAELAVAQRQCERAVRLYAAGNALFNEIGQIVQGYYARHYEHNISVLKSSLGDAAFTAAWDEGRSLTLEQAIEVAATAPPR